MKNNILEKKTIKKKYILVLHVTDRCNNRCRFCMVDDIHNAFDYPYKHACHIVNSMPQGAKIDLFGGEPTLYPYFFNLLTEIYKLKHLGSVASNCRRFANIDFTCRAFDISHGELYVRTTLHGHTARIHDDITGVIGSFKELMSGLHNVVSAGMPSQVNIVITKNNLPHLETMTQMIIEMGVKRIKFGIMLCSNHYIEITPLLSEIRPNIINSICKAQKNGLSVIIEKAPLCFLPEWIHEFSTEREISPWPRFFDDKKCNCCVVRAWCDGLDPLYARYFGTNELNPITRINKSCVKDLPVEIKAENIHSLKLNLFKIPNVFCDRNDRNYQLEYTENIMSILINESKNKCSRVAFVPPHLIF